MLISQNRMYSRDCWLMTWSKRALIRLEHGVNLLPDTLRHIMLMTTFLRMRSAASNCLYLGRDVWDEHSEHLDIDQARLQYERKGDTMVEAVKKGLEIFRVPEADGENVFTISFTVYSDGSITLPSDLTASQSDAMRAYITWNNEHMREIRGNSLEEMPEEKGVLLDRVIETLKTPEQVERERITSWVLQQHTMQKSTYQPFVSWFEETYDHWRDEWIAEGACTSDDKLYEVHITESYDGSLSYRQNQVTTIYTVVVQPDTTLRVLHSLVKTQIRDEEE